MIAKKSQPYWFLENSAESAAGIRGLRIQLQALRLSSSVCALVGIPKCLSPIFLLHSGDRDTMATVTTQ